MDKFLTFTIVGLSTAAIYAVIASGLVLTYTTTGIFNFAQGASGMLGAFCYWQLHFEWGWSTPVALFVVLAILAPLFGALLELVIFRGLEGTTETIRLVVSISLLVGLIGLAQIVWDPGVSRPMENFFAKSAPIDLGPTTITWHQAITIMVAIAVAIGLRFLLYRIRIGIAMRGAVDDRGLASLNGARPDRISMTAWAVGTSLAALGGILVAPGIALNAATLSLLIVTAYAAAIVGRLRSLPLTFLGAVVLGLTEAYLAAYLPQGSPYLPGLRLATPAILLFIVLLALPATRLRTRIRSREFFPLPSRAGGVGFAAAIIAGGIVMVTTLNDPDLLTYGKLFSLSIIALSIVPLTGYAGQISLCQFSIAGIGGVVMAHHGQGGDPLGLLWAVVICAVVGGLVALPALRLSGIYLALGTAAFALALDRWIFNLPPFSVFGLFDIDMFGTGSANVDPLKVFGYEFNTAARQVMLCAVVLALLSLLVIGVRRSRFGRQLLAMKDSEAARATLGLNLLGTKLAVFALSAAIAGLGGALYSMQLSAISPGNFDFFQGLPIFALTAVGGIGAVGGALFAGISLYVVLPLIGALAPGLAEYTVLLPGLAGIGLGRNPNGAVRDMREAFLPVARDRRVLIATVVALVALFGLRVAGVIDNWPYAILTLATPLVAAGVGMWRERVVTPKEKDVPWEWRGILRPWSARDVAEMDSALSLSEVELHGAA